MTPQTGPDTGTWQRGAPEETYSTYSDQVKQLGDAAEGSACLSTGRDAGYSYGANDLDDGEASILSPDVALPDAPATLSFSYNFAHGDNADGDDHLRIAVVTAAGVTTVWERLGVPEEVPGAWRTATVDLSAYAGQTIALLVTAADAGTPSLVEAQLDDVSVTA